MNRELVMAVLYDIALVIGSEVSVRPLLTRTLQRLLYHTSFPAGLVFLDPPLDDSGKTIETTLDAAVGDFGFSGLVGQYVNIPAALLRGAAEVGEAPELLQSLPGATRPYNVYLRLPIDNSGVMLLVAPRQPTTQLPLSHVFQPVMTNLAKAILLCRHNDVYTAGLVAERDVAQQSLAESEESLKEAQRIAHVGNWDLDHVNNVLDWSEEIFRIFEISPSDFGATYEAFLDAVHPDDREMVDKAFTESVKNHTYYDIVHRLLLPDGRIKYVNERCETIYDSDDQPQHTAGTVQDITAQRESEIALQLANRALKTLSGCNGILVRATEEQRLLEDICRLIVDTGGYSAAWVGYASDDSAPRLRPVASAGIDQEYIDSLVIDLTGSAEGKGAAAHAFATGKPQVVQDIAADDDYPAHRNAALQRGIASTIALPLIQNGNVFGVLKVYASEREAFDAEEVALLNEMAEDLAFGIATLRTRVERRRLEAGEREYAERLQRALLGTIQAVALTVEKRDPYTAGHQLKVALLAVEIARELGWSSEKIEGVRLGAMIHDIGKIYVPSEILNRPSKLSDLEFEVMRRHPQVGYDIVKDVEFPWPVAQIILQHHERLDGSGYPNQLSAEQIIPEARVLAVADVVEAVTSHRPYRPALGLEVALQEITHHRGSQFDAEVVDACLRVFRENNFSFD